MVWAIIEDRSGVGCVIFMESFVDFYLTFCDFVVCLSLLHCPVRQLLCSKVILLPMCLN